MAIQLSFQKTERILFCASKWWGDPEMPANMEYPTIEVTEEGETYDYPLTFLCQINCEDIAAFDHENRLPHEGMLYFFAAIDRWHGFDSPTSNDRGEWSKGHYVVKYAKSINFETFNTCMLTDDEDQPLTDPELEIIFSECADDAPACRLLGMPGNKETGSAMPDMLNLLQIASDELLALDFGGAESFCNFMIKEADLHYGNWKKAKVYLSLPANRP